MRPRDAVKSAAEIRSNIRDVLRVDFVEWNQVDAYMDSLNLVLDDINSLGESEPVVALDLAWHFIKGIPAVFNNVHDEWELAAFCTELAREAWDLAKRAGNPMEDCAARLLDAYSADAHDTCRFDGVLDILAEARLNGQQRRMLAAVAVRMAGKHPKAEAELRAFAKRCSAPKKGGPCRTRRV